MSKQTEALKLALEALECKDGWGSSSRVLKERAVTSLRTALNASKIEGDLIQRFYEGEEAKSLISEAEEAITALREALAEQPAQQEQGDSNCQDADGCPTEMAVLQRFWRGEPIPTEHYPAWFRPAQQQEPVAWMDGYRNIYSLEEKAAGCEDAVIPLVPATLQHWSDCAVHNEPAYPAGKCDCGGYTPPPNVPTARASKPWVGLTDDEIAEAMEYWSSDERSAYGGAMAAEGEYFDVEASWHYIEAKLKEKNT